MGRTARITEDDIQIAYSVARMVYLDKLTPTEGRKMMVGKAGVKRAVATDFIYNFKALMKGQRYTRTLSSAATRIFICNIRRDFGEKFFNLALKALLEHIEYYEDIANVTKYTDREIHSHFSGVLNVEKVKEQELDEILSVAKVSKEDLRNLIQSKDAKTTGKIKITIEQYQRDYRIIALLKKYRGYKCQICGESVLTSDGKHYVEAAHITPKHDTGAETPDNILILCPNHHKEFDYGDREILSRTEDRVQFKLNGIIYTIDLRLI